MNGQTAAREWLVSAEEEIEVAAALLARDKPFVSSSAFHCQQAAEKLAKALIAQSGHPVPRTHDVSRLAYLLQTEWPQAYSLLQPLRGVTAWYITTRYPGAELDAAPADIDVEDKLAVLRLLHGHVRSVVAAEN